MWWYRRFNLIKSLTGGVPHFTELDYLEKKHEEFIKDLEKKNQKEIYSIIDKEIKSKSQESESWVKALRDADGDEKKAISHYIDLRFKDLWKEATNKVIEPFKDKLKEEYEGKYNLLKNDYKVEEKEREWGADDTTVIRICPSCQTQLRVPRGKTGAIKCTKCEKKIYTKT
jgi:hypothetical protein